MKTYFVTGRRPHLMRLCERASYALVRHQRGVFVFRNEEELWQSASALELGPKHFVLVAEHEGDRGEQLSNWARRTRLDELDAEYMSSTLPSSRDVTRAKAAYKRAVAAVREAEKALDKAKAREYTASENLVRCMGRGSVVIDEVTYDVTVRGETVFYLRRDKPRGRKKNTSETEAVADGA